MMLGLMKVLNGAVAILNYSNHLTIFQMQQVIYKSHMVVQEDLQYQIQVLMLLDNCKLTPQQLEVVS